MPDAAIALQDDYGVDVNLLFYLLWLEARGRRVDAAGTAAVEARVAGWRESVVRPLCGVRRWMKEDGFDGAVQHAMRDRVKGLELKAERLQQAALAVLPLPGAPDDHPVCRRGRRRALRLRTSLECRFDP